jgi:hypothetical protein
MELSMKNNVVDLIALVKTAGDPVFSVSVWFNSNKRFSELHPI